MWKWLEPWAWKLVFLKAEHLEGQPPHQPAHTTKIRSAKKRSFWGAQTWRCAPPTDHFVRRCFFCYPQHKTNKSRELAHSLQVATPLSTDFFSRFAVPPRPHPRPREAAPAASAAAFGGQEGDLLLPAEGKDGARRVPLGQSAPPSRVALELSRRKACRSKCRHGVGGTGKPPLQRRFGSCTLARFEEGEAGRTSKVSGTGHLEAPQRNP